MAHTMAGALRDNFLGNSPVWYKNTIIAFLILNPILVTIPLVHGPGESFGYRVGNLAYVVDCSAIPKSSWGLLEGLEVLVIDALRFREHESHFTVSAAVEVAQQLQVPKTLLTHLTHDVDYPRHSAGLPDGIEFAYDGQTLTLPLAGS